MSTLEPAWKPSEAQAHFADLIDRALASTPQFIRKPNGEEVVLISKSTYDALLADARELLLRGSKGPSNDPVERAIDEGRR